MTYNQPNNQGFYGQFGGQFVPETLMTAVKELEVAYEDSKKDPVFQAERPWPSPPCQKNGKKQSHC